jgi:mono/diheme cytochrome c family protein
MQFMKWIFAPVIATGLLMAFLPVVYAADEAIPAVNPYSGDKKAIRSGRSWYRNVCSNCHGGRADGQGERGTGADLRKFKKGFNGFVQIVLDGRKVKGRIQYMPAWRGVLQDKDIYQIGAYLETLAIDGANWK